MKSWNTPSIESISSTKCRNTASTQSTSSTGSLNTSSADSVPEYRSPKYSRVHQYSGVSKPKILQVQAVSRVFNPEILRVLAVSRSTQSPNTASTWSTWSIFSWEYFTLLPGTRNICGILLPGGWDGLKNSMAKTAHEEQKWQLCDTKSETFRYNLWFHDLDRHFTAIFCLPTVDHLRKVLHLMRPPAPPVVARGLAHTSLCRWIFFVVDHWSLPFFSLQIGFFVCSSLRPMWGVSEKKGARNWVQCLVK